MSPKKEVGVDLVLLHSDALRALKHTYGFVVHPEFRAHVVKDKFGTLLIEVHKFEIQVFTSSPGEGEEGEGEGEGTGTGKGTGKGEGEEPVLTLFVSLEDTFGDVMQKVAKALQRDRGECAVSFKEPHEAQWHERFVSDDTRLGDVLDIMGKRLHLLVVVP